MDANDIQQDSGRYLQEYVESLENLPSEIAYHCLEIQSRHQQYQEIERRMDSQQNELTKIHRQWSRQSGEKPDSTANEAALVKRIKHDYDRLKELASERLQIADEALHLIDRHFQRLKRDLDEHDESNPDAANHAVSRSDHRRRKTSLLSDHDMYEEYDDLEDDEEGEDEDDEDEDEEMDQVFDYEAMMAHRQQKQKRKEAREGDANEPLYCYCRQVSFGEMVGCDGEHCRYEWFHMECVGLNAPPKGAWYCNDCKTSQSRKKEAKKLKRKSFLS